MSSYQATKKDVERKRYLADADGIVLGRLASKVARILIGKHKPTYTPHIDCGDMVVIINSAKVKTTGRKNEEKKYYKHTGYIGSMKEETLGQKLESKPSEVVKQTIKGMLPANKLLAQRMKRLEIFEEKQEKYQDKELIKLESDNE